ncbi:azurin [Pseudomonas psychrotolerans]|nr:azurin [Pseudomonas psychrotolerans]
MLRRTLTLVALAGFAQSSQAANCEATVDGTDMMTYSVQVLEASRGCPTFTLHLTHSGNMPKSVMGHNWVLAKASDAEAIDADGGSAGFGPGLPETQGSPRNRPYSTDRRRRDRQCDLLPGESEERRGL